MSTGPEPVRSSTPRPVRPKEPMPWALVRLALSSTARLVVVPAQDLLGLDGGSRMNTPGTDVGNWAWQAPAGSFDHELAVRVRELAAWADRIQDVMT